MSVGRPQPDIAQAPEAHERLVSQTPETLTWTISEYVKTEQDGDGIGVWTEYQVEDGVTVIATGITDRDIAEDIANLPLLRQMVQNGLAARLVPVQRYDQRPDHAVLVSIAHLQEEILAELKRANAVERTGAVSSVEMKFLASGAPQPVLKAYAGSEVPVDEALEAYGRLVREANERAMHGWAQTAEALKA